MAAVLDAFASKLASKLVDMAVDKVEMLLGVPGEITKLETTLGDLSSILGDAERRRIRDKAAERWVRELKDVMYDADDILDLCQIMEGEQDPSASKAAPKSVPRCWKIPTMFSCFRNPVVAHEIGKKIQALNQRLLDLQERSSRFGFIVQAINSSAPSVNQAAANSWSNGSQHTGPSLVDSDIVGEKVEESKRELIDVLIKKVDGPARSKSSNISVAVAITGAGGIGKTTLARIVFNDATISESFDKKIWLSVGSEVNEIGVLQRLIAAFGGSYDGLAGDKALLEQALKQIVGRQKKFFLVMDDVWSDKVWTDLLRAPLIGGAFGSQILVTTRNSGVAHGMKAQYLHRVDKLGAEDAWILLKKHVVLDGNYEDEVDELKDIGIKLVERCDGLPLAVKVLGGLLLKITGTRSAWEDICNHFTWWIEDLGDDINRAVYLSYEELHSHLKQCFVYCALFPKDQLMRRNDVIQLWIAGGCLPNNTSSKLPEELGIHYYSELVSRNLLEPDKKYVDNTPCTMHDVVRSFAQYIIKDEGLLLSEGQTANRTPNNSGLRHLSVSNKLTEWDGLHIQASLRTLMLFGDTTVHLKDLLSNIPCLRILYIDSANLDELPDSICHLRHLRYLCLSYTSISTLPEGIGGLKFLQAIDLAGCGNISQLPDNILKLRKLRLLNIIGTAITSIPRGFGKLEDMIVLLDFPTHSDDGWCSLEELGPLSKLRELRIRDVEKAYSGSIAAKAMLSSKKTPETLTLEIYL